MAEMIIKTTRERGRKITHPTGVTVIETAAELARRRTEMATIATAATERLSDFDGKLATIAEEAEAMRK